MRELVRELRHLLARGEPFALARVVQAGSDPHRPPGEAMAVSPGGDVIGSLSGGCVEASVYERAMQVLADGQPALETYALDDDGWAVGPACGAALPVIIHRVEGDIAQALQVALEDLESDRPIAWCTAIGDTLPLGRVLVVRPHAPDAEQTVGSLGETATDAHVSADAIDLLEGRTATISPAVHVEVFPSRPRLLVFGASAVTPPLCRLAECVGYRITVCDARSAFTVSTRFPGSVEVVVEWPHRYLERTLVDDTTAICVLTHDSKFDLPVLECALRSSAGYVGAMGSRHTHRERLTELRKQGLTSAQLSRLRAPIGLDIGGRTPSETAVSILAEIVQARTGSSGLPLTDTAGRIHHSPCPV